MGQPPLSPSFRPLGMQAAAEGASIQKSVGGVVPHAATTGATDVETGASAPTETRASAGVTVAAPVAQRGCSVGVGATDAGSAVHGLVSQLRE